MNRRQRHRVEVLRSQTASKIELEFLRKYFETVLDTLLTAHATTGAWCGPGSKEFQQYRQARQQSKKGPMPSGLLVEGLTQQLEDEACWHVAKFLSDLYQTRPFGGVQPAIVEVPDHRFSLTVAVSKGPSPSAVATLPFRTWDAILNEVGQTIWVDFLLWRVNLLREPTTPREVLMGSEQALRARLSGQQELSSEQWALTWEQQATSAID